ncbi:MAG TPA: c-type cytochrome domain-containing protein [Candidatus Brocadiia bacterium]|nr:c-type cytochrome domain-containing protein [Candidatus Brocadiales bacterium]
MTPSIILKAIFFFMGAVLIIAMTTTTVYSAPPQYWEVQDIFYSYCTRCHYSEGAGDLEAGLVLNSYQELMEGDSKHGPVVTPGNADDSILIQKIGSNPPFGARMPYSGAYLSEEQINTIRDWINAGANGPTQKRIVKKVVAYPRGNIINMNKSACEIIKPVDGNIIKIRMGTRVFFKTGYGFIWAANAQGLARCEMKLYIKEGDVWVLKGNSPILKKQSWGPNLMSSPIHRFSKVFGVWQKFNTPGTYEVKAEIFASTKAKLELSPRDAFSEVLLTVIVSP